MENAKAEKRLREVTVLLESARQHIQSDGWWNKTAPLTGREISDLMHEKELLNDLLRK